jgi:hypothetical protein
MNDDELFKLYAGMAMQALITAAKVPWDLIPQLANEMAQIHFNFGKSRIDLRSLVEGILSSGLVLVLTLWLSCHLRQSNQKRFLQILYNESLLMGYTQAP